MPFSSFYWYVFETIKPKYATFFHNSNSNTNKGIISFAAAASAGMLASVLTHPFDVLKTRQQLSEISLGTGSNNSLSNVDLPSKIEKIKGNVDIRVLYKEGGIRGLYKGIHLRMATVVPAGAIMITVYEAVKRMNL